MSPAVHLLCFHRTTPALCTTLPKLTAVQSQALAPPQLRISVQYIQNSYILNGIRTECKKIAVDQEPQFLVFLNTYASTDCLKACPYPSERPSQSPNRTTRNPVQKINSEKIYQYFDKFHLFAKRSQTTTKEVLFCIPDHLQDKNFSSTKQILRHHIHSDTLVYQTTSSHGVFFTHILSPGTFSRAKSTGIQDTLKQGPGVALKSAGYQTAG